MSKLVNDSVFPTIVKMALPMLAGTFSMTMYNITNAWFVSRLGTSALAAISFTFPVVMLLMFLTRGLGTGAMTLVAHAIGSNDKQKASELIMHAILLAVLFAIVLTAAGILTIRPVFSGLGATGAVLDITEQYMFIWYLGAVIMVVQMVTSDMLIGTGNTKAISLLMVAGTLLNAVLDYGLIFGKLGMPALGIAGAAVATIISQAVSLAGALYILYYRMKLIDFYSVKAGPIFKSLGKILKFGIPGALGMILTPISSALITKMVAQYGDSAVAACGVATRIEMFAFMIPMTVGMSLIPFIAQNYGAGRMDRIRKARNGTMIFAFVYGLIISAVFFIAIDSVAGLFSNDLAVIDVLRHYIFITCAGYGFLEIHRYAGFSVTGIHEPMQAAFLNIIRVVILLIPLSILGENLFQLNGIFFGRLATDILAGVAGIIWSGMVLASKDRIMSERMRTAFTQL